jgi:hypothetical protein
MPARWGMIERFFDFQKMGLHLFCVGALDYNRFLKK